MRIWNAWIPDNQELIVLWFGFFHDIFQSLRTSASINTYWCQSSLHSLGTDHIKTVHPLSLPHNLLPWRRVTMPLPSNGFSVHSTILTFILHVTISFPVILPFDVMWPIKSNKNEGHAIAHRVTFDCRRWLLHGVPNGLSWCSSVLKVTWLKWHPGEVLSWRTCSSWFLK